MQYIDDFLEYLKAVKKHSYNTIINYKNDLCEFYHFTRKKILKVDKELVNSYLNCLYEKNDSKSTVARKLSSLRNFYEYLGKKGIVDVNYFKLVKNPRKDMILPKYVVSSDIEKMMQVPDVRGVYGKRNLAIMRLLYATGVRVSELVNIKIKDIDLSDRTIKILGKGSKERMVVFGHNAKNALDDYIFNGRGELNKKDSEYVFLNKDGGRLSTRYVRKILDETIIKASILHHVSPHMLRHTFATEMLNNGADLVSVKDLLGHESLNTTSIYTHVTDEMIRKVYNNSHPRAK